MTMKQSEKYTISSDYEHLFAHEDKESELEHEAKMLMFRFLSELERTVSERKLKKADIAKAIGTSASYVTQLYRGDKLINLLTLAKLQAAYDLTFEVKAKENKSNYQEEAEELNRSISFSSACPGPVSILPDHSWPDEIHNEVGRLSQKHKSIKIA